MKSTLAALALTGCLAAPPDRGARHLDDAQRNAVFDDLLDTLEAAPAYAGALYRRVVPHPRIVKQMFTITDDALKNPELGYRFAATLAEYPTAGNFLRATFDAAREDARRAITVAIALRPSDLARMMDDDPEEIATMAMTMLDLSLRSPGATVLQTCAEQVAVQRSRHARL